MRTRVALLVGAVLLGALVLAGSATALQADGQTHVINDSANRTTNETSAQVGVCMVGVDSPCNGEPWDGGATESERSTGVANDTTTDEGTAGICLVGADSPCNGQHHDDAGKIVPIGDAPGSHASPGKDDGVLVPVEDGPGGHTHPVKDGRHAHPAKDSHETSPGICLIGADTACNSGAHATLAVESTGHHRSVFASLFDLFVSLF